MNQIYNTDDVSSLFAVNQQFNKLELIHRIKGQHIEILQKLLPEIDLHFAAVLSNDSWNQQKSIHQAYQRFCEFVELLTDHIQMEDQFILPKLEENNPNIPDMISSFIEKHDDFEMMILQLLNDIEHGLAPLKSLLSFRILLLKMERLHLLLQEHNLLEDLLFSRESA